jgi:hypothetical protein
VDTRGKIRPAHEFKRPALLVSGYFDPLLAAHAERLEAVKPAGVPLAVIVAEPPDPVLPARARAEMVAALRAVDAVFVPEPGELPPAPDLRFEAGDLDLRAAFVDYVRSRQS